MIVRSINMILLPIFMPFALVENRFYSFTYSVYCPVLLSSLVFPLSSLARCFMRVFVQL